METAIVQGDVLEPYLGSAGESAAMAGWWTLVPLGNTLTRPGLGAHRAILASRGL